MFAGKKNSNLAISDKLEEEAGDDGAKALGNPIENAGEDADVASDGQSESDSWIQMST